MKKFVFSLILGGLVANAAFAQEVENAIFVDLTPTLVTGLLTIASADSSGFGIGLGYERGLSDNLALQIPLAYVGYTLPGSGLVLELKYFSIASGAHIRFYPLSTAVRGFFIDGGCDYTFVSIEYGSDKADSHVFTPNAKAGWKFIFGDDGGFFLEPGLGYRYGIGDVKVPVGSGDPSLPATQGLLIWLGLGAAF